MPAAAVIPAIIGAGASVGGALLEKNAAQKASQAQQQSQQQALNLYRDIYTQQRQDVSPYLSAGTAALGNLMHNYGPGANFNQNVASTLTPYAGAIGMPRSVAAYQPASGAAAGGPVGFSLGGLPGAGGPMQQPFGGPVNAGGSGPVRMVGPDGTAALVPPHRVQDALRAGARMA